MKLLLVDLDDTLIDTSTIKDEIFEQVAKKLDTSVEQVEEIYEKQKMKGVKGWLDVFENMLSERFHKPAGFLHPLVHQLVKTIKINNKILNYVRKYNGYKVIFSYGDPDYQDQKIEALNLRKEFDAIIVTYEYKLKFLDSIVSNKKVKIQNMEFGDVLLIDNDDRLLMEVSARFPWIRAIHPDNIV